MNVLNALKAFIETEVAAGILLEHPQRGMVSPAVFTGYVPPKNYLPAGYDIPGILICIDKGSEDNDSASIGIRMVLAVYSEGTATAEGTTPDMKGYEDLLNLNDRIIERLTRFAIIPGAGTVEKPIVWELFEEQKEPYWASWLSFGLSAVVRDMVNTEYQQYL